MLIKIIRDAYELLSQSKKKRGWLICFLLVIQSGLDVLSLAVFFPLLTFIIDPEIVQQNRVLNSIYTGFSFSSYTSFVVTFTSAILVFIVIKNLIGFWITRVKARYIFEIGAGLAAETLDRYMHMNFIDFSQVDFAREMNRIASHPIAFANNIILPVTVLISEGLVSVILIGCIAYVDVGILIVLILVLFPAVVLFQIRKSRLKEISLSLKEKFPLLLKHTQQAVEAFSEIRIFLKESFFKKRFTSTSKDIADTFIEEHTIHGGTIRFTEIVITIVICVLVLYSVLMRRPVQETIILLGLYAGASFRLVPSMNRIMLSLQQIRSNEYLLGELKTRNDLVDDHYNTHEPMSFNNSIELDNVSFVYPGRPATLKNISLTILKGTRIAITGDSGEGKTTLLLILLRLLKETTGNMLVDNKSISSDRSWHGLIAYVPQNPYILDASLAENIAFGVSNENIDRPKILQLISGLDLMELVRQLPEGIDTRIGERGSKLSGGQRQRIALARALYLNAAILILDEATNQVHGSLESDILKLLDALKSENRTIIMVTHKIATNDFFDTIYRLENGELKKNTS